MDRGPEDSDRARMLSINEEQTCFYDEFYRDKSESAENDSIRLAGARGGLISQLWESTKRRHSRLKITAGAVGIHDQLLRSWAGDVSGRRVLDLGPGRGHEYSIQLAQEADSYLAVDLSGEAVSILRQRLQQAGCRNARAEALDILSPAFRERGFDVIHARSVLHHFENPEVLARRLHEIASPNGIVLSLDPLKACITTKCVRTLIRPFQSDSAWEWPLTRHSIEAFERYFTLEKVQGLTGCSKWAIPVGLINQRLGTALFCKLHQVDMRRANRKGRALWSCIHIVMMLRRSEAADASSPGSGLAKPNITAIGEQGD